ncbi:MAG: IS1634 family transposase [Dehalococcoidia bacterium]|jgi:transposase
MYIRTTSRKNKDGSVVRYVQLAHNVWDPKAGCSKTEVIRNLGREEDLDRKGLQRLVENVSRYLGEEIQTSSSVTEQDITFEPGRSFGGVWALDQMWRRMNIDKILKRLLKKRQFETPVERLIFAMVANRALAPSSKLAIEEWVEQDTFIPDLPLVPVQQLYRSMDFLLEADSAIQHDVFFSIANLFNLEVDLLYFDTTSTYFETEEEDDFRRNGHSKDHRPDLPQAVIGLAVTRDGIPVRCWVWPGNTADMSVIEEVKKDLNGWKLNRVIGVIDRGFSSEDNLRYLQRAGGHYIAGERMRSGMEHVEEALSRPGRFKPVADNLEIKEVVVGDGEARIRYVLARNPKEAERDKAKREIILSKIREELAKLGDLGGEPHCKACCELIAHKSYGRYLKMDEQGQPHIDKSKVKAEERLDGKYLIRTSDDTLSPVDVALGYKQLYQVENAFRTLKTTLELRPVYHRIEDRIRSHILLCWLALLLVRVIENQTGESWTKLRRVLSRIQVAELKTSSGSITKTSTLNPALKQLFKALEIPEPPRILDPGKKHPKIS